MRPEPEGFTLYPSLPFIRGLAGGEPQCSKSGLLDGRTTFFAKRQFSLLGIYASHSYPSSSQYKPAWRGGPNAIQIGKVPRLNIQASHLRCRKALLGLKTRPLARLRVTGSIVWSGAVSRPDGPQPCCTSLHGRRHTCASSHASISCSTMAHSGSLCVSWNRPS